MTSEQENNVENEFLMRNILRKGLLQMVFCRKEEKIISWRWGPSSIPQNKTRSQPAIIIPRPARVI